MGGLREERFGESGERERGMGEWRQLVETTVKQDGLRADTAAG